MRAVGVEEAAAIRAKHLDRFLRGDRSLRDGLRRAFQRLHIGIGMEVLRYALPHEEQRGQQTERQQNIERAPRQVHPEVADAVYRPARKAAYQRDGDRHARRRRHPVMDGKRHHIGKVTDGRFRHVGLPVGVGRERSRRVERQIGRHVLAGEAFGIERQMPLQAQQHIGKQQADHAEHQHGERVCRPLHVLVFADAK